MSRVGKCMASSESMNEFASRLQGIDLFMIDAENLLPCVLAQNMLPALTAQPLPDRLANTLDHGNELLRTLVPQTALRPASLAHQYVATSPAQGRGARGPGLQHDDGQAFIG